MPTLGELLDRHVRPRAGDELAGLLLRADVGARLMGAAAMATAGPTVRGPLLPLVDRGLTGLFLAATRECLLGHEGEASRAWRPLLRGEAEAPGRGVDEWIRPYEISLRHTGMSPPATAREALRAQLREELDALCGAVCARADPLVEGQGAGTTLWGVPCAPLLELHGDRLHLWERGDPDTARWRRVPGGDFTTAAAERGRVGLRRLAPDATEAGPLEGSLVPGASGGGPDRWPAVVAVDGDLDLAAHALWRRWASADRPLLRVRCGRHDDPLARMDAALGDREASAPGSTTRRALEAWAGPVPLVLVVGDVGGDNLLRTAERLGRRGVLVAVVHRAHLDDWLPSHRRQFAALADRPREADPTAVAAFGASPPEERWVLAAAACFGLVDAPSAVRLLALLEGRVDPFAPEATWARSWLDQGELDIDGRGRPVLRHPGWQALEAGLRGRPLPEGGWTDAHAAGTQLRARFGGRVD